MTVPDAGLALALTSEIGDQGKHREQVRYDHDGVIPAGDLLRGWRCPDGDAVNDDYRDRVVVIDRNMRRTVCGHPRAEILGTVPGYLNSAPVIDTDAPGRGVVGR